MVNGVKWRVVGASVQGSAHQERGLPCQDAHLWRSLPGGALVLAVADGAGSAAHADEGAQQAVQVAVETLSEALWGGWPPDETGWETLMHAAFAAARDALGQRAAAARRARQEFATTLACAVVAGPWLVTGQLGDGWIVAEDEAGRLFLAAHPQRGEYANEAYFLTMEGAADYVQVRVERRDVRALAASTDGLLRLALRLPAYEPHGPFFRPLFAFAATTGPRAQAQAQLVHFLDAPHLCARTDDDKTLVLATRSAPPARPDTDWLLLAAPAGEDRPD